MPKHREFQRNPNSILYSFYFSIGKNISLFRVSPISISLITYPMTSIPAPTEDTDESLYLHTFSARNGTYIIKGKEKHVMQQVLSFYNIGIGSNLTIYQISGTTQVSKIQSPSHVSVHTVPPPLPWGYVLIFVYLSICASIQPRLYKAGHQILMVLYKI